MLEYIEVFRREAKTLYKNFQKNDTQAIARFKKVYGNRDDLSLMSAQHVIAKEYGFNSWDEIAQAEKWELAGALNIAKNKMLTSPLALWYQLDGEGTYSSPERHGLNGQKLVGKLDVPSYNSQMSKYIKDWFHIHDPKNAYIHINHADVSEADLFGADISKMTFDEFTIWPSDEKMLPKNFNPREFLEKRKNPGLGVRNLHKQGIDGRNRNVAIISEMLLINHLEYQDNLVDYVNLRKNKRSRNDGGWSVSTIAGKTCGVAPKAKVYFYTIDTIDVKPEDPTRCTEDDFVKVMNMIFEVHNKLVAQGKNGIDIIVINGYLIPHPVSERFYDVVRKANDLGIFVNCSAFSGLDKKWNSCWPNQHDIALTMYGDADNPKDYTKWPDDSRNQRKRDENWLVCPSAGKTITHSATLGSYFFNATTTMMKEWQSGLYILCKSVKEDLTPEEFYKTALKTGNYRRGIGTIVNPLKLIEALKK